MVRAGGAEASWDDLAELDPYWAILSDSRRRHGGWQLEEFLRSGQEEVATLLERAVAIGHPREQHRALDFGCGVGRLTRALASRFDECIGLDISERMVERAKALPDGPGNCRFIASGEEGLRTFENDHFDLIYTRLVLQHVPRRRAIRTYVQEFVRILRPGGLLVFQLPNYIPMRHRVQPRPRAYATLRRLGVPAGVLYRRLNLQPIRMNFLPLPEVRALLDASGGRVLQIETEAVTGAVESSTYFVSKDD